MSASVVRKNWKPVELRCMIQDILGNEIYSKQNVLADRTIFYCITVPGENEWVRTSASDGFSHFASDDTIKCEEDRKSYSLVNFSYPIPSDGKNKSCLIKVYDKELVDHLRVNDIVQVAGLIEPDEFEDDAQLLTNKNSPNGAGATASDNAPNHVNQTESNSEQNNTNTTTNNNNNNITTAPKTLETLDDSFEPASDFPHHLVPRVHVRTLKKLKHINPLLPEIVSRETIDVSRIRLARVRLSTILSQLLGGDTLAAEYLILSLISRIHRRKDVTTLGQLTIGLSGVKPEMKFLVEKLCEIISKVTTHSHFIDMSIANLNTLRFTPHKDHENNKMIAGSLQLPDGLYLVLNETALSEGILTPQGTENLETLGQIIRWQRLNYSFKFHTVEIDTDLRILVISEGKSIMSAPYTVRLANNDAETIDSMREACAAVNDFLTEDLLNMFRYYITALKEVPEYTVPEDVQKRIQDDFCMWRKNGEASGKPLFSASDLSSYMTLARYVTISRGETVLSHELWQETCQMETARMARLSA